jgi:U3 small nucleolar RNA-associated protein 20
MVMETSRSRAKPVKRLKKGTKTTKSHRFELFSQRIAKLKIDPIHRVRGTGIDEAHTDADVSASYFKSSLDHWADINLSENFTEFVRRARPLSEVLPQILHHEETIMALLIEFIEKRDQHSIEPLLSLLSQFARDLGARFERHFAVSVAMVASVAATHISIEVVEWSFTCLAWIFKFLSRLLVPDLRPLLGIMAPYLGKERQKPYVSRFAAESMSFVIRKAARVHSKDKSPLQLAVAFILTDIRQSVESRTIQDYKRGIMSMFSDAIKGVNEGIHSNGITILRCLLDQTLLGDEEQFHISQDILQGVIVNIIHHTTAETFSEVLDAIIDYVRSESEGGPSRHAQCSCLVMFLIVNTRKGNRIKDWKQVHETLLSLIRLTVGDLASVQPQVSRLLTASAVALQHSPMDEMLPYMRPIMESITHVALTSFFLPFCLTFSEFGSERFHTIVLPYFKQ